MCYNCGEHGHPAKECTKNESRGKGKDQGKEKRKEGVWEVGGEEEDWNLGQPEGGKEAAIEAVDDLRYVPIRTKKYASEIF